MPANSQGIDGVQVVQRVEKPWGYQLIFALTPWYAGAVNVLNKGHSLSLQYHEHRDETLYLYQGKLQVELENEIGVMDSFELGPGHSVRFSPMRKHRITALDKSVIFEVSTPQMEDVVRLEDHYGRAEGNPDGHPGEQ